MTVKTNKLSIYLIKKDHTEYSEIVKDSTKGHPNGDIGIFYTEESHTAPPDWINSFFLGELTGKFSIFTASARGLLLVKIKHNSESRIFAVIFGLGRHLLNDEVIEERFGLKVVLNSVVKDSLRSIDKTTLGSVPKQSREQMSRESEAGSFGLDIEQDLINAVTGRSKRAELGKTISGRDPLAVSVKVDLSNIQQFLPICLKCYESNDYKKEFEWVDQIKDVRDNKTRDILDAWLVDKLIQQDLDRVWMAPPTLLDWVDVKGFRYTKKKLGELYLDLDAKNFLKTCEGQAINIDLLKAKAIHAISSKTDDACETWTALKCFYAEAQIGEDMYVLNHGKWYKIASSFTQQVLADFNNLPESNINLPPYTHNNEGDYNESIPAVIPNSCCMDRQMIPYGGGHSSIEFCDLYTAAKQIVHVKRYGGAAQFSHLFNQGVVSGELFVREKKFRDDLNIRLPQPYKFADTSIRPDPREYEIVFAIISKSNNPLDIPFFSKVSLRNARRRLEAYGYAVRKKQVSNLPATA